jgi:hypothetical protein
MNTRNLVVRLLPGVAALVVTGLLSGGLTLTTAAVVVAGTSAGTWALEKGLDKVWRQ